MTTQAVARSISRPAKERLRRIQGRPSVAQVLAVFDRVCDLVTVDGDVIALVAPQIGDGPLNIVLDGPAGYFAGVTPGAPVRVDGEQIRVEGLEVVLDGAAVWEPCPNWDALRARVGAITSHLPLLRALCTRHAPADSLMALLMRPAVPSPDTAPTAATLAAARSAADALREGWQGNTKRLREGAAGLAGLGSGLTPAGDDFLTGAMLWAWAAHPTPGSFCRTVVEAAAPRTTTLSAAFLQAAARGECSAPWHALLAALSERAETGITLALHQILAHGATSGADALAGFLCFS